MTRDLKIKRKTKKGVKTITLPQIKMGETMFVGNGAKKAVIAKKLIKKEEKEAVKNIGKVITALSNSIKKDEKTFISGMVELMKKQADLMRWAREQGLSPNDLMVRVKESYLKK